MASYRLKLTPDLVNLGTEGSLDTSVSGGVSYQRTGYIDVYNSTNRKIVEVADGETFTDTMVTWASDDTTEAL
mgnify:CR=1 FL=1